MRRSLGPGNGRDVLYGQIRKGRLKAKKAGRYTIITDEDLREYVADLPPLRLPAD